MTDTEYLSNCQQENIPDIGPTYLLGIDFETTGTDLENDNIIEVGLVLFDWDKKKPIVVKDFFIDWSAYPFKISKEISDLTGIYDVYLSTFGVIPEEALREIKTMMTFAKYIVAYNGNEFDKPMLINNGKRFAFDFSGRHWLDVMTDIDYPESIDTRKLEFLAAKHGFLNPFAHRAVFDVLTMFKIMSQYDLDKIVELAKTPMIEIRANVNYDDREKAKKLKYQWDGTRKLWTKKVKEIFIKIEEEKASVLGVRVSRLGV